MDLGVRTYRFLCHRWRIEREQREVRRKATVNVMFGAYGYLLLVGRALIQRGVWQFASFT